MAVIVGYAFHAGDLFHVGHLYQLQESKKYCDYLVVGILTDRAIAAYKREPIIPYPWRAAIYEALSIVDEVMPQNDRDPTANLKVVRPDILFHGDDWDDVPGSEWMESQGLQIIKTKYFAPITTTQIIEAILERQG